MYDRFLTFSFTLQTPGLQWSEEDDWKIPDELLAIRKEIVCDLTITNEKTPLEGPVTLAFKITSTRVTRWIDI